jgi:hypothetical protein
MHAEIYTDGIGEITVGGSIVRVDLVTLSPTERDANDAPAQPTNGVGGRSEQLCAGRANDTSKLTKVSECFKQFPLKIVSLQAERKLRQMWLPAP